MQALLEPYSLHQEVADFLNHRPSPREILEFEETQQAKAYRARLKQLANQDQLREAERAELECCQETEHVLRRLKMEARMRLNIVGP